MKRALAYTFGWVWMILCAPFIGLMGFLGLLLIGWGWCGDNVTCDRTLAEFFQFLPWIFLLVLPSVVMVVTTYLHFRLGARLSLNPAMRIPMSFFIAIVLSIIALMAALAFVGILPEFIIDVEGDSLFSWIAMISGVVSLVFSKIFVRQTKLLE